MAGSAISDARDHEFAVISNRDSVSDGVVPDETGRRVGQGIDIIVAHAVGIAAWESGKALFHVIGADRRRAPLMSVRAEDAGTVGVVQQHEFIDHLVLVRRDLATEDAKIRSTTAAIQMRQTPGRRFGFP